MELERDIRIVVLADLDEPKLIELRKPESNEFKIRSNDHLKTISELGPTDQETNETEFIDGFRMKCQFIKSQHILKFTQAQDRSMEIVEAVREQPYIEIYSHYPIESFDLCVLSVHQNYPSMSVNDWWKIYKEMIGSSTNIDDHNQRIRLFCAPAFNLPLPRQMAQQCACLIKFYDMFKSVLFSIYRRSSSSIFLSHRTLVVPALKLSHRPEMIHWFDERIKNHPRLKRLREENNICLVAFGSRKISFQYDFTLMEQSILKQLNASELELMSLVQRFALKHLRCSLDNRFLRTSILWICEKHDLNQYHDVFEVWASFMNDVCRKHYLSHYFLQNMNIFEHHPALHEILKTINHENIDIFIKNLNENLIFPYFYQYHDRMTIMIRFLQAHSVLAMKMKTIYTVHVKSQFPHATCSLEEMSSIICHLSFLEDNDSDHWRSFWHQQWKPLFIDFDRSDIVLQDRPIDDRPDQMAQEMTESVLKLIELNLVETIESKSARMK